MHVGRREACNTRAPYACTYSFIITHPHTYTHTHTRTHTHTYTHTHTHIHTHTHTHAHTHTHTYVHLQGTSAAVRSLCGEDTSYWGHDQCVHNTFAHAITYTYVPIQIHIRTYIHEHLYTCTPMQRHAHSRQQNIEKRTKVQTLPFRHTHQHTHYFPPTIKKIPPPGSILDLIIFLQVHSFYTSHSPKTTSLRFHSRPDHLPPSALLLHLGLLSFVLSSYSYT
jgi:hypothetical protein